MKKRETKKMWWYKQKYIGNYAIVSINLDFRKETWECANFSIHFGTSQAKPKELSESKRFFQMIEYYGENEILSKKMELVFTVQIEMSIWVHRILPFFRQISHWVECILNMKQYYKKCRMQALQISHQGIAQIIHN